MRHSRISYRSFSRFSCIYLSDSLLDCIKQMNTILEEQFKAKACEEREGKLVRSATPDMTGKILAKFVRLANKSVDAAGTMLKEFFWKPKLIQTFNNRDQDGFIVEQATSADLAAEDAMVSVIY